MTNINIFDNHNDLGWQYAQRWLRAGEKAYKENEKDSFVIFLKMRERELFHLIGDNKSNEKFLLLCELGLSKFNIGGIK
jgi:hypothetical protein